MTCKSCRDGKCEGCVDTLRSVFTTEMICTCTRKNHLGEAVDQQVKDPETGIVYAPGLAVDALGEVAIDPVKRQAFIDQYTAMMGLEEQ